MNVSVSTLAGILGQTTGQLAASPRPDVSARRTQSPADPSQSQPPADSAPHAASGHDSTEIQREPASQGTEDFNDLIRKKTQVQETQETQEPTKPSEKDAESKAVDQPASPSHNSDTVQRTENAAAEKSEPKSGKSQPREAAAAAELNLLATAKKTHSELTAVIHTQIEKKDGTGSVPTPDSAGQASKSAESQPGQAESSAELNLLVTATKSQSGLTVGTQTQPEDKDSTGSIPTPDNTVSVAKAAKSQPVQAESSAELNLLATATKTQSGLKIAVHTQPAKQDNTASIPTPDDAAPVAKAVTKETNATELMPEAPVAAVAKTPNAGTTPAIVETPTAAKTPTTPSNAKDLVDENLVDGKAKTTHTGAKIAADSDLPATPKTKPAQPQGQVVTTDQQRSVPTPKIETELATAQTPSKLPSPNGRNPAHNSSKASSATGNRQWDVAAVQTAAGQTQAGENSNSNGSLSSGSEQMLSQTTPPTQIDQPSTTFAAAGRTASSVEQNSPSEPYPSLSDQVLESVRSSLAQQTSNRQITIQLHPPELGKVSVKIQEEDAQITGMLEVSKAQTRSEIEQALPQIIRNLADSGVQIRRLEVVLSQGEDSQQQAFRDHSLQDSPFGQHSSANSESSSNQQQDTTTHYGPTGRGSYRSAVALQEMVVGDDSIDIFA